MERLQKFLAHAGIDSRRKCEELISAGRVKVNGAVVTRPGTSVDPNRDVVSVDGAEAKPEKNIYLLINKPRGYICSSTDPVGRLRVINLVGHVSQRIYSAGRLDYDSEGLLILTNDGDFAERVIHPRRKIPKVYEVTVKGEIDRNDLKKLQSGMVVDGHRTKPVRVEVLSRRGRKAHLEVTIHEGRNRQIKLMFEQLSCRVQKIRRVKIGPIELGTLRTGRYRKMRPDEINYFERL